MPPSSRIVIIFTDSINGAPHLVFLNRMPGKSVTERFQALLTPGGGGGLCTCPLCSLYSFSVSISIKDECLFSGTFYTQNSPASKEGINPRKEGGEKKTNL